MALKIRLRQQGRTNQHTYRLVVTDVRNPRDGKYIEMIGWYNPTKEQADTLVQGDRLAYWLSQGAELTSKAYSIVLRSSPEVVREYEAKKLEKKLKELQKRRKSKTETTQK